MEFSAGSGGAWSQDVSQTRAAESDPTASHAGRRQTTKAVLALRKKNERADTTYLLARLELLAPRVDENKGHPGPRSKALRGRTKEELLNDVVHAVRLARMGPGALEQACTTQAMSSGALERAFTTQAGAGLIAIELKSGNIAHHSLSFQNFTSWIPVEARGNIRVLLEARGGDDFHSFCQSVVRDAGELHGETFLGLDKVLGRSITVQFLTRAPGPSGLRNPEWLLMVRAVELTLVGVQPRHLDGKSTAAGMRLPFWGQRTIPEAIGVFTADLSGGTPQQWTLQVAHVRYLLDMEVALGTYDTDTGNQNPFESLTEVFNCEFLNEGGGVFSRAAGHLQYAATSAFNIAQRSALWLTRKALRSTYQWAMRLNEDDTVSIAFNGLITLFGGLSTKVSMDFVGGKVGFSHGGMDILYFVADPEQPLLSDLRATIVRISSTKTGGEFDVARVFVVACTWGGGNFQIFCKRLSIDKFGKTENLNPKSKSWNP